MAILIFLIVGRYIQRAAKVPIFEHFLGYRSVFCLRLRLTFRTFQVLSNTPYNIRFQKATKELKKHLPLNTSVILQDYTSCHDLLHIP